MTYHYKYMDNMYIYILYICVCVYVYIYILDNAYPIVLLTLKKYIWIPWDGGRQILKGTSAHKSSSQVHICFFLNIIYNTYIIYYLCTYGIRIQMDRAAKKAGRETNHPFMDLVC